MIGHEATITFLFESAEQLFKNRHPLNDKGELKPIASMLAMSNPRIHG